MSVFSQWQFDLGHALIRTGAVTKKYVHGGTRKRPRRPEAGLESRRARRAVPRHRMLASPSPWQMSCARPLLSYGKHCLFVVCNPISKKLPLMFPSAPSLTMPRCGPPRKLWIIELAPSMISMLLIQTLIRLLMVANACTTFVVTKQLPIRKLKCFFVHSASHSQWVVFFRSSSPKLFKGMALDRQMYLYFSRGIGFAVLCYFPCFGYLLSPVW